MKDESQKEIVLPIKAFADLMDDRIALKAEKKTLLKKVKALKTALEEARTELADNSCLNCGEIWDCCRCRNGSWWRKAAYLLREDKDERA